MADSPAVSTIGYVAQTPLASTSAEELRSYTLEPAFRRLHTVVQLTCVQAPTTSTALTPHSVLLITPPGTGKTTFLRLLASHCGLPLVHVRPVALSPQSLSAAFDDARRRQPAVLCMDDAELLLPRASDDETWQYRLLSSFLDQLAALSASTDRVLLVLLCSTAGAVRLSPAVRSAVEVTLEASLPTSAQRLSMLQHMLAPLCPQQPAAEVHPFLPAVVAECGGMSGADLQALVREAAQHALSDDREALTYSDFQAALRLVSASSAGDSLKVECDKRVMWDDIVGMDHIKQQLQDCLIPLLNHSSTTATSTSAPSLLLSLRSPPGVLLYGPPGTGKTLLAQAMSSVPGISFLSLSLASLLHSHIGESERALLSAFQRARSVAPAVLFIDELDALFSATPSTSTTTHTTSRLTSTLCTLLDTIHTNNLPLLLLTATNLPQHLTTRLLTPTRLGHCLHVTLPSAADRVDMAGRLLAQAGMDWVDRCGGVGLVDVVSELSVGFSMADVRFWMGLCLRGRVGGCVGEAELRQARATMSGSVSAEMARGLQRWEEKRRVQIRERGQRLRDSGE